MGVIIRAAIGDAILTSIWVFSISTLRILTAIYGSWFSWSSTHLTSRPFHHHHPKHLHCLHNQLYWEGLRWSSFNPSTTVTFYTAGLRPDSSLASMAIQFPAQAAGEAVGAKTLMLLMPAQYKHMLKGPFLKVDLHTGAIAEGALTFTLNLVILIAMLKGPKNPLLKVYLLAVTTVALVIPGSGYVGPFMNPANAFGRDYMNNKHNTWEQFYVSQAKQKKA